MSMGWEPGGADTGFSRLWLTPRELQGAVLPGATMGGWQALGSAQQWLLGDYRILVPSTHSLRPSPLWRPQGLRGHLLQPEAGRGVGGQGSRLHWAAEAVG